MPKKLKPQRIAEIWMKAVPMLCVITGLVMLIVPMFTTSKGSGENWSFVLGGAVIVVGLICAFLCLPAYAYQKFSKSDSGFVSRLIRAGSLLIPVLPVLLPGVGEYRILFIMSAAAGLPLLFISVVQMVTSISERKVAQ